MTPTLLVLGLALAAAPPEPRVVHVTVALCDNDAQGIVPVPKKLGNGQDPRNNLYWGARYGVRTHLLASGWARAAKATTTPPDGVLERLVLTRAVAGTPLVLVADAWDGRRIEDATRQYLRHAAAHDREVLDLGDGRTVAIGGAAHLTAYVGHDGLMDFDAPAIAPPPADAHPRDTIALACITARYFAAPLAAAGARPIVTTHGLMAPEAYVLDAAIDAWVRGTDPREASARAYAEYQKCGLKAARALFGVRSSPKPSDPSTPTTPSRSSSRTSSR